VDLCIIKEVIHTQFRQAAIAPHNAQGFPDKIFQNRIALQTFWKVSHISTVLT